MTPISFRESQTIVAQRASLLRSSRETIKVREAIDRVLAEPIYALRSNPPCELAAMDGLAVNMTSVISVPARFQSGEWQRINTGDPVTPQWNAVVKIEDVEFDGETAIVSSPISLMQHIRIHGEDFHEGALLFSAGYSLTAGDLSLLLTAGHETVEVHKKPVITFLPTGSELVSESELQIDNKVLESNSAMIRALVESWGGLFHLADPVPDNPEILKQAVRAFIATSDIVVVSAGTSMGTRDLSAAVIQELGTLWFHGVEVQPAKPVFMGQIGDVPVVGLPGYPVSAYIASIYFLKPLVAALSGRNFAARKEVHISAEDLPARKFDTIYRVNVFDVDGRIYVRKLSTGAGSSLSLAKMDGLMHVPAGTEIHKRDAVRVDLIHDRATNTLAIRGIEDPAFRHVWDLFNAQMPAHRILFSQSSAEEALQNIIERNCHIAIINTFGERDLFPEFARQLQENMMRYRILSRTVSLSAAGLPSINSVHDLPENFRVVIPRRNQHLWEHFATKFDLTRLEQISVPVPDEAVLKWLQSQPIRGSFVDIRFLKPDEKYLMEIQEHFDLIVSETYSELPSVKKLIDLLSSPQYADWISTFRGCDPGSRGLLHETYDVL